MIKGVNGSVWTDEGPGEVVLWTLAEGVCVGGSNYMKLLGLEDEVPTGLH